MKSNDKQVNISVRLDKEEKDFLSQYAKEHDLTISQIVRQAIKQYLALTN